jgi:hypothetical protein
MKLFFLVATALADYPAYTIPSIPAKLEWKDEISKKSFQEENQGKEYVDFQMPDDDFVPIEDLPVVYLNGIKFHRQGKDAYPLALERFRKLTRSSDGKLECKGAQEAKQHKKEHLGEKHMRHQVLMANDVGLDLSAVIYETKYPRYNGKDVPLPYNELLQRDVDLSHLEPETEDEEYVMTHSDTVGTLQAWPSDTFVEPEIDNSLLDEVMMEEIVGSEPSSDPFGVEEALAAITPAQPSISFFEDEEVSAPDDVEKERLARLQRRFLSQESVKIGCCNGTPYKANKRCCCRRVSFDKEKKFCCAINGCESFQIFDRDNKNHYRDCLSLSGNVVQEYGYRGGVNTMEGEPTFDAERKSRPTRPSN